MNLNVFAAPVANVHKVQNSSMLLDEAKAGEVFVKEELDIDTVELQPLVTDALEQSSEVEKATIKEELEIGPTLLQPSIYPRLHEQPPQFHQTRQHLGFYGDKSPVSRPMLCIEWAFQAEEKKPKFKISSISTNAISSLNERQHERMIPQQVFCSTANGGQLRCGDCSKWLSECDCVSDTSDLEANIPYEILYRGNTRPESHIAENAQNNLCKCNNCSYTTRDKSLLKYHLRICVDEKRYRCEHCDYIGSELTDLVYHMRVHAGLKLYQCHYCDYKASKWSQLKFHSRKHTGEKPYRCQNCHYSASRLYNLHRHLHSHADNKPYKCQHCDYSSSDRTDLIIHRRTHKIKRVYKCEYCSYNAPKYSRLTIHLRTHTGERPFKCDHCEYSATERRNLNKHLIKCTAKSPIFGG